MSWTPEQTPATVETEDHIEYAVTVTTNRGEWA